MVFCSSVLEQPLECSSTYYLRSFCITVLRKDLNRVEQSCESASHSHIKQLKGCWFSLHKVSQNHFIFFRTTAIYHKIHLYAVIISNLQICDAVLKL